MMTMIAALSLPANQRSRLVRSLPGLVLGGLFALAGLLPALRLNAGLAPEVIRRAEEIYVFDRLSHHLVIRDFASAFVIRHGLMIAVFAVLWQPLQRQLRFQRLAGFVWAAVLLAIFGTLLDVMLGESPLAAKFLRYYWFRALDVFVPLGVSLAFVVILRGRIDVIRPPRLPF